MNLVCATACGSAQEQGDDDRRMPQARRKIARVMSTTLRHPAGEVWVDELPDGKRRITVQPYSESMFVPRKSCVTSYPAGLIELILNVKGPSYLCDEIARDEDPSYVQALIQSSIWAYVDHGSFANKRILDFGCGCGASTIFLARKCRQTQFVGVELDKSLLTVAAARVEHYGCQNVAFSASPSGDRIPTEIGDFDYIIMNTVYEHLLPNERRLLLPQIWSILKQGGVLFIIGLPYRYSPIEQHTTGLPLLNYFPDKIALAIAHRFSKRVRRDESWASLLRKGIRGGSVLEILNLIRQTCDDEPVLLEPNNLGLHDRVDLWYLLSVSSRLPRLKRFLRTLFKMIKRVSGVTLVPYLSLAVRKGNRI